MEPKVAKDIPFRLLELEQRFESYCTLHEEELAEIKETLRCLREDVLRLVRDLGTHLDGDGLGTTPESNLPRADTSGNIHDELSL
jgi:hypothetical protein